MFPIGIGMAVTGTTSGYTVAVIGGVLELLSMLIFAVVVWRKRPMVTALKPW